MKKVIALSFYMDDKYYPMDETMNVVGSYFTSDSPVTILPICDKFITDIEKEKDMYLFVPVISLKKWRNAVDENIFDHYPNIIPIIYRKVKSIIGDAFILTPYIVDQLDGIEKKKLIDVMAVVDNDNKIEIFNVNNMNRDRYLNNPNAAIHFETMDELVCYEIWKECHPDKTNLDYINTFNW